MHLEQGPHHPGALAVGMNAVVSQFGIQLPGRTREGRVVVDEVAAVVGRVVALRVTLVVYANVCSARYSAATCPGERDELTAAA